MAIIEIFKQFFNAISKIFDFAKTNTEYAAEKDVLKTKKELVKENVKLKDILKEAIELLNENKGKLEAKSRRKIDRYLERITGIRWE